MYKDYYGLKEEPFSIAPDPQFLYMSERHREALSHLVYGMKVDGGFVLLTGEVGTGKTTICRCLLEQIPENSEIAFVFNPKLTATELLETICDELRITIPFGTGSNKAFIDALNAFLLETHSQGRKTVLIIDEAQNLQIEVLEQVRLLTNLETNKQKLLQVIILGQPELKHQLERPELRQLSQRITARYHLEPLSKDDIQAYVRHRLAIAGVERPLFPPATINKLYELSGGVPRLINLLCDRALLGAYVREEHAVSPALLTEAAGEVFGAQYNSSSTKPPVWLWTALILVCLICAGVLWQFYAGRSEQTPVAAELKLPINKSQVVKQAPVAPQSEPDFLPEPLSNEPLTWTSSEPIEKSSVLAYQALFALWGYEYRATEGAAGTQAQEFGLNLISRRGSLGRLRLLNRPAVLTLNDPEGKKFYATITALGPESATLVLGTQVRIVPTGVLNSQWFGEFTLLWQAPPEYSGVLQPGGQGALAYWLEERFAALNGRATRKLDNPVLEGQLLEELKRFQTESGLTPDGMVGTYTLILLNSRSQNKHPTLTAGSGG